MLGEANVHEKKKIRFVLFCKFISYPEP